MESTYGQVGKALCGKENATAEEIIAAFDQVKRERDALILYAKDDGRCGSCKHIGNSVAAENALQCPNNGRCDICDSDCPCAGCDYFSKWEFDWSYAEDAVQRFGEQKKQI